MFYNISICHSKLHGHIYTANAPTWCPYSTSFHRYRHKNILLAYEAQIRTAWRTLKEQQRHWQTLIDWLIDYVKIRCEKLVQGFYAVACWLAVKFVSVLMKSNVSLFCHRATSVHNSFHNLPMCCQYLPCQPEEQELTWMRGKMTSQHRSSCSSSSIKSSM